MEYQITYEVACNVVIIVSWILSLYLILLFDGIKLSFKNIRLFSYEYEILDKWDKLSFHVYTTSKIGLIVIIVFSILFGIHNPDVINFLKIWG